MLCGDAGNSQDVDRLMQGRKATLCLTDPPYGIGESYESFDDTKENLSKLISRFLPLAQANAERVLLTPGNMNQWLYPKPDWTLCWFVAAGTGRSPWGFSCWQPFLAYGKDPYLAEGKGSRPDALALTESADNDLGHPVSKPVKVWSWFMERGSINKGDIILDLFTGSGTGIVAAEQLARVFMGIEIEPSYCAVTLERMTQMGLKCKRILRGR